MFQDKGVRDNCSQGQREAEVLILLTCYLMLHVGGKNLVDFAFSLNTTLVRIEIDSNFFFADSF